MKNHFAVSVIGKDRPGIVAETAEVLFRLGCNIEDSSCTMLAGEFAMILIVSHDKPFSKGKLQEDFKSFAEVAKLSVFVRSLAPDEVSQAAVEGQICVVTVYGADKPGIVYRTTRALADRLINITDLNTRLVGTAQEPVYVLTLEAMVPDDMSPEDITAILEKVKGDLDVDITVRTVTPVTL